MNHGYAVLGLILSLAAAGPAAADSRLFPHRAHYHDVSFMEIEQLRAQFDRVRIVDVRTRFEYDTLHIKGAVHVPLHSEKLPAAARDLRAASTAPIVFYCNGTTCKKSYEAARLAMKAGVSNVHVYDAGVDVWSTRYPELTVLMGKDLAQAGNLISERDHKARMLSASEFDDQVNNGAVVLDIRDTRQRDVMLFPLREVRAPLDYMERISAAVDEARKSRKPLLVYDKVGKQVRWFQYYLEQQGVKDYYFLAGGSEGYHEAKHGKLPIQAR